MKSLLFRQLTACVVMMTVLFGTVAPLGACWCPGCYCESSVSRNFAPSDGDASQEAAVSCCSIKKCCRDKKSCCAEPAVDGESGDCCRELDANDCCGCGKPDGTCRCSDLQKTVALAPKTDSPAQKSNNIPACDVAIDGISPADAIGHCDRSIFLEHQRLRFLPPVPLHVLLCVFLN